MYYYYYFNYFYNYFYWFISLFVFGLLHLHRDTSRLCHKRMKFDIYVRHDIMRAFSVLWCLATCNMLCPTKPGPRGTYTSPLGGSTVCEEVPHIQPYPENKSIQGDVKFTKVRSNSYVACICISNPNSGVTYRVFHKILKSYASYIFQVRQGANVWLTVEMRLPWKFKERTLLAVYFLFGFLS